MLKNLILVCALSVCLLSAGPASAQEPKVLISKPEDGAKDVAVDIGEISIFFSQPMNTGSWSLLEIQGHEFPPVAATEPPWKDGQTFVLKVKKLNPDTSYGLQLNSAQKKGFQTAEGKVSLPPTPIRFKTVGKPDGGGTEGGEKPKDEKPEDEKPPKDKPMTEEERIALHVMGGIVGIFFHELGHGLIDLLKLPITGREEDVVDEFAAMLLLFTREEGAEYVPEIVYGFADLWRLIGQSGEKTPWWDEHTDAMVRFGNVVCLLYGSSPKEFQELANRFKMPERRQYFCREEYPEKKAAWEKLLKDHLTVYGAQGKGKATVVYTEIKSDFSRKMEEGFKQERVFESLAEGITKGFALPRDITIVPSECGQANAFWDPEKNQIIMCYEMVKLYVDLLDKELSGGGGDGGTGGGGGGTGGGGGGTGGGGGGTGGGGGQQPETSIDSRIIGRWGGRMDNQGITFTWGLTCDNNGRYEYVSEQWRMGMRYYWEDQSGRYTADNNTITFYPQDGSQVGGRASYNYKIQNNMLTIKGVPSLQGGDMVFHRLQ